ncbi:MAG: DUF937 domain-containing protein [Eubacteriales bacterium]
MDLLKSILKEVMQDDNLDQLSEKTNISRDSIGDVVKESMPAILEGLNQNTNKKSGAESLLSALSGHNGSLLDNVKKGDLSGIDLEDGAKIIGHIFGSNKEDVAGEIAGDVGIDKGQSKDLLSALAPIVMSALSKEKEDNDLDADGLSGLTTTLMNSFLGGENGGDNLGKIVKLIGKFLT